MVWEVDLVDPDDLFGDIKRQCLDLVKRQQRKLRRPVYKVIAIKAFWYIGITGREGDMSQCDNCSNYEYDEEEDAIHVND